jgi:hypothetical protein
MTENTSAGSSSPANPPANPPANTPDRSRPLFYQEVVPLNKERHGQWYMKREEGFSYAREANSVFLLAAEIPLVANECPVVFVVDPDQHVIPVAAMGLKPGQNLFVDEAGRWDGTYIPAYIRRYPFILATPHPGSSEFTVCVDETYPGFNSTGEGIRLLDDSGTPTQELTASLDFLRDFQQQSEATLRFGEALKRLQILEPVVANAALPDGETLSLTGFFCINRQRLKALSAQQVKELVDQDHMELIFIHLHSLLHLNDLTRRAQARKPALAPA